MKKQKAAEAGRILDTYITGYHEYLLGETPVLTYASQNLCDMIQYSEEELVSTAADLYLPLVHPADCGKYQRFLADMRKNEGTQTLEYRIVKRDGEILYVADTMTSAKLPGEKMMGFSTLADITKLKEETDSIQFINDTVPCGLLRYTCEKTPRITYANEQMIEMMRINCSTDDELNQLELYESNIYLMIAPESRSRFAQVLQSVYINGTPHAGELSVVKGDSSKGRLFGWVTKCKTIDGKDEFQSICMDITKRYEKDKNEQERRYLRALSSIYDLVFEFDRVNQTVRYLQGNLTFLDGYLQGIPMQLEQATEKWLNRVVQSQDRSKLRRFLFAHILKDEPSKEGPPQIYFRIRKADASEAEYQAILLEAGTALSYFCCREVTPGAEESELRRRNDSLTGRNADMQELIRHFTDGVVAFEIEDDKVRPLYVSDNAYAFFGFSDTEWAEMTRAGRTIREFVSGTGLDYERFEELFSEGEATFTYKDVSTGKQQKIKAVCSSLKSEPGEKKYVMLYRADNITEKASAARAATAQESAVVEIHTFGYFDIFVSGRPIMFKSEKAKELLAILVDRRGGYVTADEAISLLWEDEPASPVVLSRYRKIALRLKNTLEEYGVSQIVESVNGKRRLATEYVDCDLYRYLSAPQENVSLFHGSYLTNYSWGEITLGELTDTL